MNKYISFVWFSIMSSLSFGQNNAFHFSDSIVEVGQVYRFELRYSTCVRGLIFENTENDPNRLLMDSIVNFIMCHPNFKFEIASHTDSRGSDSMNLKLSQIRAESVKEQIIKESSDSVEIVAIGYGERQPIHLESEINQFKSTDKAKFDRLHQENRRTELKIVGIKE